MDLIGYISIIVHNNFVR